MRNVALGWIALSVALVIASCSSSDDDPADARRRCEALRDHVIDLRFPMSAVPSSAPVIEVTKPGAEPRPAAEPFDVAPHRAAMKQALGERYIDACVTKMSVTQI